MGHRIDPLREYKVIVFVKVIRRRAVSSRLAQWHLSIITICNERKSFDSIERVPEGMSGATHRRERWFNFIDDDLLAFIKILFTTGLNYT